MFKSLKGKLLKKFIKIVKNAEGVFVKETKVKALTKVLDVLGKLRGRKFEYDRVSLFRLVCEAFSEGKHSAKAIARYAEKPFVRLRYWVTKTPSHDTISDFFNSLIPYIEEIFNLFVRRAKQKGLFRTYVPKLIDTTDIRTRFWSDPNAQWNKDTSKNRWYWGYGGIVVIDAENHLPCAGRLTYSKKVDAYTSMEMAGRTIENVGADVIIGDSEFDIKRLEEYCNKKDVLFITRYNPRNTKQKLPITYRTEITTPLHHQWLDKTYKQRIEVEHSIGTMKENTGIEKIYVKGYEKVNVQFLMKLCMRLLQGIEAFDKGLNPRGVT